MNVADTCLAWCWRGSAVPPLADGLLSPAERERAARLRHAADRTCSVTAAALVRLVVADWRGAGSAERADVARELSVDRTCSTCGAQHGPPRVSGGPHLSVTHTGVGADSLVVVAATAAGAVGVDAEAVTDLDFAALAPTVLAPEESAEGAPRSPQRWFAVWTRKEAVLKATGDGLRTPMSEVVLGDGGSLVSYRGDRLPCVLRDLDIGPDTAAALAVLGASQVTARLMDARQLFG